MKQYKNDSVIPTLGSRMHNLYCSRFNVFDAQIERFGHAQATAIEHARN